MSKTITSAEYNAWLEHPLTKGLKRSFEQSITDPENQPSQYGTVTLEMYEALESEITTLKSALKMARDSIDKFLVANDPTEFGCACDLSVDYLCGPCHADKQQQPLKSALAKINEVLKP